MSLKFTNQQSIHVAKIVELHLKIRKIVNHNFIWLTQDAIQDAGHNSKTQDVIQRTRHNSRKIFYYWYLLSIHYYV